MASEAEPARDSNRATGLGCLLLVGFMLVSALGAAYLGAPASAAAVAGSGGAPAPSGSPSSTPSSAGDAPRTFNGSGSETPSWVNLSLSVGLPMDVVNPLLAYDPARDAIVLAGGSICLRIALGPNGCPQAFLSNSTWEYRGGHWTNISMDVGPCPKAVGNGYYQGFMVWDPVDSYLVLWDDFGATNKHGYFYYPQTWVLGSGVWTNITYQSASQPGKSGWAVYDPVDSYLLYIDSIGDTWNFTHGIWTWLGPWEALNHDNSTAGPPFQQVSELAWDSADQQALLYGEGAKLNQTWTFVGGEWTNTNTTGSLPPGNASIPLFYDDALHGVVYYGGPEQTSTAPTPSYTWVYSNGTWANITSAVGLAPPRPYYWGGAGAPDPQDGYYLVFAPVLPLVWPYPYLWAFADRPVAVLTASPYTVEANSSVAFDGQIFGGVGPFSFAYTDLPAGCAPPTTIVFPCRPTGVGTYEVGLNVTDSDGESGNTTAPLHVLSSLSLSVAMGPAVLDVGQPWNLSANVSGGLPSYSYAYTDLPAGCESVTSTVSCRPSAANTYSVGVRVTDSLGLSISWNSTVTVEPDPVVVVMLAAAIMEVGETELIGWNVSGGVGPYNVTVTGLPAGCPASTVSPISCRMTTVGVSTLTVLASDSLGETAQGSATITVVPHLEILHFYASPSTVSAGSSLLLVTNVTGGIGTPTYLYTDLPTGCSSANTSVLDCTPSASGTWSVYVLVHDVRGEVISGELNLTVSPGGTFSLTLTEWAAVLAGAVALVALGVVLVVRRRRTKPPASP